jgi:hypothetical protein
VEIVANEMMILGERKDGGNSQAQTGEPLLAEDESEFPF